MFACTCGWTLITQEGEEDAKMHIKIHMKDVHPEKVAIDEDLKGNIKTV